MTTYTPDRWVMLDFISEEYGSVRKVLAGWYGGYLGSNSWKLSSGVEATRLEGEEYHFDNSSGSLYICHKQAYGLTGLTGSVLSGWMDQMKEHGPDVKIKLLRLEDIHE